MKICNKNCCGCTLCYNICPKNAITMLEDEEGFQYPYIDETKCIDCGLCKKECILNNPILKNNLPLVYACKNKDDKIRMESSSGGIFSVLADYVLALNGVVYGATFDENFNVVHEKIMSKTELFKLRGSKYVQSYLGNIFSSVLNDLINDKYVLFVGTPCQIASLKSYLLFKKQNINKLILCDLICHGVPSPLLWREHIKNIKKNMKWYYFRTKENGWNNHTEKIVYKNNSVDFNSAFSQSYKYLFHTDKTLRPSCYECSFTSINRVSDITIGDYWGIKINDFDDNKGVSLVLLNTELGKKVFEAIKNNIIYVKSNEKDCLQVNLIRPTEEPYDRKKFWKYYYTKGYDYVLKKYTPLGEKYIIKNKIKRNVSKLIPIRLKNKIKNILK